MVSQELCLGDQQILLLFEINVLGPIAIDLAWRTVWKHLVTRHHQVFVGLFT